MWGRGGWGGLITECGDSGGDGGEGAWRVAVRGRHCMCTVLSNEIMSFEYICATAKVFLFRGAGHGINQA